MGTKWVYGVTTVPARRYSLLPRTLQSLAEAGFESPSLFVDGARNHEAASYEAQFGLSITTRYPKIRTYGNWVLSLAELYIREPIADRYAIFQDDFVTYPYLRSYLDRCVYPERGYWNLYTFPSNHELVPRTDDKQLRVGWWKANQYGRGAVGLVFSQEAVRTLLSHQDMVDRPQNADRGWKSVDGGVVNALNKAGWFEYIHYPSLVQHTGIVSSMGNKQHLLAPSFRGEGYDARLLLKESESLLPEGPFSRQLK